MAIGLRTINKENLIYKYNYTKVDASINKSNRVKVRDSDKSSITKKVVKRIESGLLN